MRRSFLFGFTLLSCAALLFTILPQNVRAATELSYARIVRLSVVQGDVQISRPSHPAWEPAAENMPMMQGVTLGTNNGFAEVQFEDGTTAWVAPNTLVQFTELALADGGRITKLTLGQGTLSVLTALRRGDEFSVATAEETITTPKSSLFRIDAFHNGAAVSVLVGKVQVASENGTALVPKGKTLEYGPKFKEEALNALPLRTNPKPDAWDRFVVGRVQQVQTETAQAQPYMNAPFTYGMADLSQYGSWNYFPGYGYGWQPMGMGSCWMPFMNGSWDFYSGFGWTWVSAEPWGWLPYHFGSWNYLPSTGWTWFPSNFNFWDPAPVNWYTTGNEVGWWPMSIGDPSALVFDQIGYGCSGFGGLWQGAMQTAFPMTPGAAGTGTMKATGSLPRGKLPAPPRLLLTTSRLGQGGEIRLFASRVEGKGVAFQAGEPLENGKASTMFASGLAAGRGMAGVASRRMFAPMLGSVAELRAVTRTSVGRSARPLPRAMPVMRLNSPMPAAGMRMESLRAVNAMPMPTRMPHRPAPMVFQRENTGMYRGSVGAASPGMRGLSPAPVQGPVMRAAPTAGPMPGAAGAGPRGGNAGAGRPH